MIKSDKETEDDIDIFEIDANDLLEQANDFHYFFVDKSKVKNKGLDKNISSSEMVKKCKETARKAFHKFKKSLKNEEEKDDISRILKIRCQIVESLVLMKYKEEAKLYMFSTVQLYIQNIQRLENLIEFDSIKSFLIDGTELSQLSSSKYLNTLIKNASINEKYVVSILSNEEILNEIFKISFEFICNCEKGLDELYSNEIIILSENQNSKQKKLISLANQGIGIYTLFSSLYSALYILSRFNFQDNEFVALFLILAISYVLTIFSIGVKMFNFGSAQKLHLKVTNNLNQIISNSIKLYHQGKYDEFIEEISLPYAEGKFLFNFHKKNADDNFSNSDVNTFAKELISYGFRPDFIGYLLLAIGKSILFSRISLNELKANYIIQKINSDKIFKALIECNVLDEYSIKLDEEVSNLSKNKKKSYSIFRDFLFPNNESELSETNLKFNIFASFSLRMKELKTLALFYIALSKIKIEREDELKEAGNVFNDINEFIKSKNLTKIQTQIKNEIFNDFFNIFTGRKINQLDLSVSQYSDINHLYIKGKLFLCNGLEILDEELLSNHNLKKYFEISYKDLVESVIVRIRNLKTQTSLNMLKEDQFESILFDVMELNNILRQEKIIELLKTNDYIDNCFINLILYVLKLSCNIFTVELFKNEQCYVKDESLSFKVKGSLKTLNLLIDKSKKKYIGVINYVSCGVNDTKQNESNSSLEELNNKANYFVLKSNQDEIEYNRVSSVANLVRANKLYYEIFTSSGDLKAAFNYTRCLKNQTQYEDVISFLDTNHYKLDSTFDFWYSKGFCYRKLSNYTKAKEHFDMAKTKTDDPEKIQVLKNEDKILESLMQTDWKGKIENKKASILVDYDYYNTRQNEQSVYKILSVDGGGIRGTIPLVILAEIEKETKRPISHLFHMVTGSSNGSLIAAQLTVPESLNSRRPKYSAQACLEKGTEHFYETDKTLNLTQKYQGDFRINTGHHRSHSMKLGEALNDIMIPVCNFSNINQTHLFSHFKGFESTSDDDSIVDVLVSATSRSNYFGPHFMNKYRSFFVDASILINNPSKEAFVIATNTHRKLNKNDIKYYVFSLGSGSCVTDKSSDDFGLMFWAKKISNILMSPQESNVDSNMFRVFNNSVNTYLRWQPQLDLPYSFDDVSNKGRLVEIASIYLEELKNSEDNKFNKFIESLDIYNRLNFY